MLGLISFFERTKKINNDEGGKKKKRKNFHNEKWEIFNGANKNEDEEMKRKRRGWLFSKCRKEKW